MSKRSHHSKKTAKRHTSPPPSPPPGTVRSSNSDLSGERLERLKDRVAKFNANITAIKNSIKPEREI